MTSHSQHRSADHTLSTEAGQDDLWIESQLTTLLMQTGMLPIAATALALPLVTWLMWHEVNPEGLGAWFVVTGLFLVFRLHIFRVYRRHYDRDMGYARVTFLRRYGWTWGVAGALWGAPVALVIVSGELNTLFVVGLVVVGHAVLSLMSFSVQLRAFKWYANCLLMAVFVSFVLPMVLGLAVLPVETPLAALAGLLLVFWWLLLSAGRLIHAVHRASFMLQLSNQRLIVSLQAQKQAALQAVATKDRFLASTAQDLRQPVHALGLYASWLAAEPTLASDIAPKIVDATRAVNQLFDSLFDLTRIDAGDHKLTVQEVDVSKVVDDVTALFRDAAIAKGIRLRTRTRQARICSDPAILSRILGHLVSNAVRHTDRGGVLLSVRQRQRHLVFEVWDTGVGIAPEHQGPIFEAFYRVNLKQGTEDSLGLGLTVVSRLSSMLSCSLSLASAPGRGSVFRLHVPVTTASGQATR